MDIRSVSGAGSFPEPNQQPTAPKQLTKPDSSTPPLAGREGQGDASDELREAFTDFVGQTLFGSMLASMRKTVGKPAYMHGGRTEEVFQQQLDQIIVEDLTESSADSIADPMFELFNLHRKA